MAGKTNVEMDQVRSHSSDAMKGRFIVSFVALILLSELKRRMREAPTVGKAAAGERSLNDRYSVSALLS